MHIAHGATQSIDNGLDTNQGSLLPDSLVIQISPFSLSHQKLASLSRNESFTYFKCVWPINPTVYWLMPMKIHSLIERTIINLKSTAAQKSPKNTFAQYCVTYINLFIRRRIFVHTSKEEKVDGICFRAIALENLWKKYTNLGNKFCNKIEFVLRKCNGYVFCLRF